MSHLDETLRYVTKKITPLPSEQKATEEVIEKVKVVAGGIIKPLGISLTIAGSFVRDTWLPNKREFDLFLLFPEFYSRDDLEKKGLAIGKKIVSKLKGKYVIAYAEHPYVRATIEGFDVDIVPCFKVPSADKLRSAVDRTPFHNEWLAKNMKRQQSIEVRLLKQFCKGQGIYGSDTKTQGLSGYLCELLIVHSGDFKAFLASAAQWKPGVFIDPQGHHASPDAPAKRHRKDPLIVIDPVDPNRNVAAALSPKNFTRLAHAAKRFLAEPSPSFFFRTPQKFSPKDLGDVMKRRETQLLLVGFRRPDVIDDTLWPQLRKAGNRVADTLRDYDFELMGWDVYADDNDCFLLFEMGVWKLPKVRRLRGPDIFSGKRVEEFRKKYQKAGRMWVEDEYWYAEVRREFTEAEAKVREFFRETKKELLDKGVPSYVAKSVAKKFSVLKDKEILPIARKKPGFAAFMKDYFEREMI